jgi:signal transduction histidine kinase
VSSAHPRLGRYLIGFAIWTVLGLLSVAQSAITTLSFDRDIEWLDTFVLRMSDWYTCAIFTPLFFMATRRWPLERPRLPTRIPLHLGIMLGAVVIKYAIYLPIFRSVVPASTLTFSAMLQRSIINEMIAFGAMAGVIHAVEYYKRFREGERVALQLQARLSDAQLRALRAQLNPHFLFNTLNAVTTLLHRDPDAADTMLTRLGELLRLTLRTDPGHETTLREEAELLERYLDVMRVRFPDKVSVSSNFDGNAADALVPSFILQPIVENAFEHGVARLQRPGIIEITGRVSGDTLVLSVRDNGNGRANGNGNHSHHASSGNGSGYAADGKGNGHGNGHGLGLENTRRRLNELYGSAGSVRLTQSEAQGTLVEVRLPYHVAVNGSMPAFQESDHSLVVQTA